MNINHYLREVKFINNNIEFLNHPEYGPLLNLNDFNKFFFGTDKIPHTVCRRYLIDDNLIFTKKNLNNKIDKDYIIISKSKKYLELVGKLIQQEKNYLLINYYNYYGLNLNNLEFNGKIYNLWLNLKKHLKTKYFLNKKILKSIGNKYFKCIINNYEKISETMYISFELYKYKHIHFSCGFEDFNTIENYINLNNPNYESIIKFFEKSIQMASKKDFIIGNLTQVTNNESFAAILYNSKEKEYEFITDLEFLSRGINITYKKYMRKEHINNFLKKYKEKKIYKKTNDCYLINFEGVNKYFLSLQQEYLVSDIDEIRDFYYSITKELIQSYEDLFDFISN